MNETTWRKELSSVFEDTGDTWDDVDSVTLTDLELDIVFDPSYGGTNGKPFCLWTTNFVYFPLCYDGSEWVGHVARHPDGQARPHQGGG